MTAGFSWCIRFAAAALGAALLLLCSAAPCFAGEYERAAGQLVKAAAEKGLTRLAIGGFTAREQAVPEEAAAAQRRLSETLYGTPGVGVMDTAVLEKMQERGRLWAQVLVKGQVYRTGAGLFLVLKAVDLRTGRPMGTMQINAGSGPEAFPKDLRDAPGGLKDSACAKASDELLKENLAAVDQKARYWAARAREPGFSYAGLDRAPGSELRDYPTIQKFYALLNAYYEQDAPVTLAPAELAGVKKLLEKEAAFLRACPETK
ncbi:MAG: hypothetical protein NTY45_09480 [Elusimicrobia bacterium]|nr:hypothetical protein [Elusimicrobiota bacterium]